MTKQDFANWNRQLEERCEQNSDFPFFPFLYSIGSDGSVFQHAVMCGTNIVTVLGQQAKDSLPPLDDKLITTYLEFLKRVEFLPRA
jgi:hypothetical protein